MENGKEFVINLPHIQLAAKQWGEKDKPIILALHGWLDNANSFEPLMPWLQDYCLIAVDWPGHGYSQHRQRGYSLHLTDYVFDLDSLIHFFSTQWFIEKVHLLGHSFGGIISTIYTSMFPERIESLILLDAFLPLFESENNAKLRLKKSIQQHRDLINTDGVTKRYTSVEVVAKARHKLTGLKYSSCLSLVSRNLTSTKNGVHWHSDPKLKLNSAWRYSKPQVLSLLERVSVKTLLLLGENSSYSQCHSIFPEYRDFFEKLEIVSCQGGHHLHMDNPKQVVGLICSFIEQS